MTYYISGDSITNEISTLQYFPNVYYYNKYIKPFTKHNNLINYTDIINNKINPLIFITKIEYLDHFYNNIVLSLNRNFVLITQYGDYNAGLHNKLLNHPLLIKWYGQNMSVISEKTMPIPIGLENNYWKRTNTNTIKQHCNNSKEKLLYLNFSLNKNSSRSKIMNMLLQKGFKQNSKLDWNNYIDDLSRHKFAISPKGGDVDCHRTWECLYLGVIPIVEKSIQTNYFNDLPILFVDNYVNITVEYLNEKYKEFQNKQFNLDKLSIDYWKKKIYKHFE